MKNICQICGGKLDTFGDCDKCMENERAKKRAQEIEFKILKAWDDSAWSQVDERTIARQVRQPLSIVKSVLRKAGKIMTEEEEISFNKREAEERKRKEEFEKQFSKLAPYLQYPTDLPFQPLPSDYRILGWSGENAQPYFRAEKKIGNIEYQITIDPQNQWDMKIKKFSDNNCGGWSYNDDKIYNSIN
jgi:hypothetical protein